MDSLDDSIGIDDPISTSCDILYSLDKITNKANEGTIAKEDVGNVLNHLSFFMGQ